MTIDSCQESEGIGSPGSDVVVGIAGIIVHIERERPHLRTIVRVASNIGHTPAGKNGVRPLLNSQQSYNSLYRPKC